MGRERRITGLVGTMPNFTALVGTVTSNTDTKVLSYTGSHDVVDIFTPGRIGKNGTMYIYVVGKTPFVSRVVGLFKLSTVTSETNYQIFLETGIAAASATACAYVKAGVAYSYVNDGSANATVNGVVVKPGDVGNYAPYQTYSNRPQLQPVSYVDATTSGADLFIMEE